MSLPTLAAVPNGPPDPLGLGARVTGQLGPQQTAAYQLTLTEAGRLVARVQDGGLAMRLSLYDSQGRLLVENDGQSPTDLDDLLDQHLDPAGTSAVYYLEVQNLAGASSTYTLTTQFQPAFSPVQPVPVGNQPAGLIWGDFNSDGVPDVAAVDQGSDDVAVLLGNGEGSFRAGSTTPVGNYPVALAVGDFDGDGQLDLAVADQKSNTVQVLLGRGDGTFRTGQTIPVGNDPVSLTAGDFRSDGRLDLAVADSQSDDVEVLLGQGDGTFTPGQPISVGSYPQSVVAGDFTGKGTLDLAVADQFDNDVRILRGRGDGTFRTGPTVAVGTDPYFLLATDCNGDGHLDLVVADAGSNDVRVLLNNGRGALRTAQILPVGDYPVSVAAGDFAGDGRADLAVADFYSNDVRVLLANGNGTYRAGPSLGAGAYPAAVLAGDVTGDGRPDLLVADQQTSSVRLLVGDGDGTFQADPALSVGSYPFSLVAGDFTGDGRPDLAVADQVSGDVRILLANGDGTFQAGQTLAVGAYPSGLVTGDFNGDGRLDLAVADGHANNVQLLLGNGDGTFRLGQTIAVGDYPLALVAGEFNGDGRLDLAVADRKSDDVRILDGRGDGTFQVGRVLAVGDRPDALTAGDFTGDGRLDLAVADGNSDDVEIFIGQADGTFQPGLTLPVGSYPTSLVAQDLTGDGKLDLAVADGNSNDVRILVGQGDGTFQTGQILPVGNYPTSLIVGKATPDGPLDLAVSNGLSNSVQILLGNGDGTFQATPPVTVGSRPYALAAADFNSDGLPDLAVADALSGEVRILLGQGDGTLALASGGLVPGPATSRPFLVDLNGDGAPDLLIRDQSGAILSRAGIPGEPGTFAAPVVVNPQAPTRDLTVVATALGERVAALDASGSSVTHYALDSAAGFIPVQTVPVPGGNAVRIAAGTLEGGGGEDLVVTTALSNEILVYGQQPDGTFAVPTVLPSDLGPVAVQFADVNADGQPDLVIANQFSGDVNLFLNDPVRASATVERYPVEDGPYGMAADGASAIRSSQGTRAVVAGAFVAGDPTDLVVLNDTGDRVTLLRGTGTAGGFFAAQDVLDLGFEATDMVSADFNGDGRPDLAFLDSADDRAVVYLGDGSGGFAAGFSTGAGDDPSGLSVAEVLGQPSLLVGSRTGDVLILVGQGDGTLQPAFVHAERNLALAAFTGSDGTLRFVSVNEAEDLVRVQEAAGSATSVAGASQGLDAPSAVAVADLNRDGLPDLLVADSGRNELFVFPGTAPGQFSAAPLTFPVGSTPAGITVADLNRDGTPDVLVADEGSDTLSVLMGRGQGAGWDLIDGPQLQTGAGPVASVVADVTGPAGKPDGIPDIVVSDSQDSTVRVLRGLGFGYFADRTPIILATGSGPGPLFLGHFAGSGLDLVTVNLDASTLSFFADFPRGLSATTQPTDTLPSGGQSPVAAVMGSFEGNAYRDLIVADHDGTLAVFAGGPHGLALSETVRATVSDITSLAFGAHGTILVGSPGGIVTVAIQSGTPAVVVPVSPIGPAPALPIIELTSTVSPLNPLPPAVATLYLQPAAAASSGVAGAVESSVPPGTGASGAAFYALVGGAGNASVVSLGPALDLSPLFSPQGPPVREDVAASLLIGAQPAAQLPPQRAGSPVTPIPSLSRDAAQEADQQLPPEEDPRPAPMVGLSYTDVLRPPSPRPPAPDRTPSAPRGDQLSAPGHSHLLPAPEAATDEACEALVTALLACGIVWPLAGFRHRMDRADLRGNRP